MVNLIAEKEVVPELIQQDFTAANVVARLNEILTDGPPRDRMLQGLAQVKARLRVPETIPGSGQHPADRAAEIIFSMSRLLTPT
jgi:lipid-A-disaccharide synthase